MAKYPALINACNQISINSFPIEIIFTMVLYQQDFIQTNNKLLYIQEEFGNSE